MSDFPDERTDSADASSSGPSGTDDTDAVSEGPDSSGDDSSEFESRGSGMRGRDVEVPMHVYKAVTVFSTLIAVVCVVGGFVVLDRATEQAELPLSEVDPLLALLGIGTILFGAVVYAFGTRFRAAGMGTSKTEDDEAADNG